MPPSASLFDRIGGEPAVDATVDAFYERVLADETLTPFFEGTDMVQQARKQKAFLTYAFGGPTKWTGRSMRAAHAQAVEQGLSDDHFDRVAGHLQETLESLGVDKELVDEVMAIAGSTRDDVLGR